jgi:DNA-binding response OmpR family regulator
MIDRATKTSSPDLPLLAIIAGIEPGVRAYLGQVAKLAGWQVVDEMAADQEIGARVRIEGAVLLFEAHGVQTSISTPVRAAKIIRYLQSIKNGGNAFPAKISFGPYELMTQDFLLLGREGLAVRLTEKEVAILACLAKEKGASVSRQALLDAVWAYAEGVETHTLETHIYRLRQKIEENPAKPQYLVTLEDGYTLSV